MNIPCSRYHAISFLMTQNPKLIDFVLSPDRTQLSNSVSIIKHEAQALSTGERVLVEIALDIWNDSGGTRLSDIIYCLDCENLGSFLRTVQFLRFSTYTD